MSGQLIQVPLTYEQQSFIRTVLLGINVLVNACIGSGKTTAIQYLCNLIQDGRRVLYLTYNTLLKADAKSKIHADSSRYVTNYHGFACRILCTICKEMPGRSELIKVFNRMKPPVPHFDVLIIDEYQDIDAEIAEMLEHIKASNPGIQIVAVGDMHQKIYDYTTLDVAAFIDRFLGGPGNYTEIRFTSCFRLSKDYAAKLGRIWGTEINGVNHDSKVVKMSQEKVLDFLADADPKDVLVLGPRAKLPEYLNYLETNYPHKYNKNTTYASIRDENANVKTLAGENCAIFTSYDSSKGLERKVCVVLDYTCDNWDVRSLQTGTRYEILRNIFLVAASRGRNIIFVEDPKHPLLQEEILKTSFGTRVSFTSYYVSDMFDHKNTEDVDKCFSMIERRKVPQPDNSVLAVRRSDGFIDLSPCIGIFQEADYFTRYDIDDQIRYLQYSIRKHVSNRLLDTWTNRFEFADTDEKVLYLTALETMQERYAFQVQMPYITEDTKYRICRRLSRHFSADEHVQTECHGSFCDGRVDICGRADVVRDDSVYELKFVSELDRTHFLQAAVYMVLLRKPKGFLYNTMDNTMYEISVKDRDLFMDQVVRTITKGLVEPAQRPVPSENRKHTAEVPRSSLPKRNQVSFWKKCGGEHGKPSFAVIDLETAYDGGTMSLGVVIADHDFRPVMTGYGLAEGVNPYFAMYGNAIYSSKQKPCIAPAEDLFHMMIEKFMELGIRKIYHYGGNEAKFLKQFAPEFKCDCEDIIRTVAYRDRNPFLPSSLKYHATGRLKKGYKLENMYRLICYEPNYVEKHNALLDAVDELTLMRVMSERAWDLGKPVFL